MKKNPNGFLLRTLLTLTVLSFSLGMVSRLSFFGQQVNVYLYEFFMDLSFLVLFFDHRLVPLKSSYKKIKSLYWFLGYLAVSFVLGFFGYSWFQNGVAGLYLLRLIFYLAFFVYLGFHLSKNKADLNNLKKVILLTFAITILACFIQYFFYPDLRNLFYLGWDPHLFRVFGTFFDSSISGAVLALFLFNFIFNPENHKLNKVFVITVLVLTFILLVLTFSRGLYVSLLIVGLVFLLKTKNLKLFLLLTSFFFLLIFLVPKPFGESVNLSRLSSITSRLVDDKEAISLWQRNPVFGIGYNRIRYAKIKQNLIDSVLAPVSHSGASFHSSFLIVLVTGGIVGLALFLWLLLDLAKLSKFSWVYIIFLGSFSLFDNVLLHPFILFLLIVLLALTKSNHPSDK